MAERGPPDLGSPYLTRQLIAYIGNKRSLLPFFAGVFRSLEEPGPIRVFLDPFAGSGAVSRLARTLGYRVLANDWELYARLINGCHLCVEERDLPELFGEAGGVEAVLAELNALEPPRPEDAYIARYYAPARTEGADYRTERLFYTAENARRIDAVRSRIEERLPGFDLPEPDYRRKMVLLASLLYQCATHTNTSGVFKACHRGFGGYSGDALERIMGDIRLQRPVLFDGPERAEVFGMDAADFAARHSGDLCYLDPPYTTHQYGSNYHLLNTVALWDKPPVSNALGPDGRLREKAGIRRDWIKTRSAFCYRGTALQAFERLLDAVDARYIVLSYNTEGIAPFEQLCYLLARRGRLTFHSSDYVKYRGGKQSLTRRIHNLELLLVVETGAAPSPDAMKRVRRLLQEKKIGLLVKGSYHPDRVRQSFETEEPAGAGGIPSAGAEAAPSARDVLVVGGARLPMPGLYRFDSSPAADGELGELLDGLSEEELEDFLRRLEACVCRDGQEEIGILIDLVARSAHGSPETRKLVRRMLWLLRKLAFRKYRVQFEETVHRLKEAARERPDAYAELPEELRTVEDLARKRFNG